MSVRTDPVPRIMGGLETIECECGWEAVFLTPEENEIKLGRILKHLVEVHKLRAPEITVVTH